MLIAKTYRFVVVADVLADKPLCLSLSDSLRDFSF